MTVACIATEEAAALFSFLGAEIHIVKKASEARRVLSAMVKESPEQYKLIMVEEAVASLCLDLIRRVQRQASVLVTLFPGPSDDGSLGEEQIREVSLWAVGVEI